jgi:hypothetical protein
MHGQRAAVSRGLLSVRELFAHDSPEGRLERFFGAADVGAEGVVDQGLIVAAAGAVDDGAEPVEISLSRRMVILIFRAPAQDRAAPPFEKS